MRQSDFLSNYFNKYIGVGELVLTAILIALGVDIIAGGMIGTFTNIPSWWFMIVGLVICLAAVLFLLIRIFRERTQTIVYEGFLIHNMEDNKLIKVPRYRLSEELDQYFTAAFIEDPPKQWTKEPLEHFSIIDESTDAEDTSTNEGSKQIVREAIEYFLLESLSYHLSDYYNDERFRDSLLYEIKRNDLPEDVLSNRFLKTISRPMQRRWTFMGHTDSDSICSSYNDGAMYRRFDLIMPTGTSITRVAANKIELDTKKFTIAFDVHFDGVLNPLPPGFLSYYLGIDQHSHYIGEYMLQVEVQVRLKFGMLLSGAQRQYYEWIDSFIDKLDMEMSRDKFFSSISWDSALTILHCLSSNNKKKDG